MTGESRELFEASESRYLIGPDNTTVPDAGPLDVAPATDAALIPPRSLNLRKQILSQRAQAAILPIWNLFPMGLFIISRTGRLLAVNRAGRDALNQGAVVKQTGHTLEFTSAAENNRLQELIGIAEAGGRSISGLCARRESGKPLPILFVPLNIKSGCGAKDPLALVILNGSRQNPNPRVLMELFGFTLSESGVATLLMQGMSVFEVAATLGITQFTVRNHFKHMYAKTRTRGQVELVHTLLCSPAALFIPDGQGGAERKPDAKTSSRR